MMAGRCNRKVMEGIIMMRVMLMGMKYSFHCLIKSKAEQFHIRTPSLLSFSPQVSIKHIYIDLKAPGSLYYRWINNRSFNLCSLNCHFTIERYHIVKKTFP